MKTIIATAIVTVVIISSLFCGSAPNNNKNSFQDSIRYIGAGNVFISKDEAQEMIRIFKKVYRQDESKGILKTDSLSRAIWFSKNIIKILSDTLSENKNLDGVRIYLAAYSSQDFTRLGQKYKYQSSLVLVPTIKVNDSTHVDAWEIFSDVLKQLKSRKQVINHGDLCPNRCDSVY